MKSIGRRFLKGLAVVLPAALTAYILYWLAAGSERAAKHVLLALTGMETENYIPGLGIFLALAGVFCVGLLADQWLFRKMLAWGEALVMKVPLVRTIFGGLRDLMDFVSKASEGGMGGESVAVDVGGGARLLGIVTRKDLERLPEGLGGPGEVAVYLPLSYQIGGFTVFFPKDRIRPVAMNPQDAMTFALTAGMSGATGKAKPQGEKGEKGASPERPADAGEA